MKLIIQIPCFNEAETLKETLLDLPKNIPGIDSIKVQIIDDGSTDETVNVAKKCGVDHLILFKKNQGLASAFRAGVDSAIEQNADILVNTDGDHQYCGEDITKLVKPIIEGRADIVIGCRPISNHPEFSWFKKWMQSLGSWVLRNVSKTHVRDAASGFRAYSREALLQCNIYSRFSYCMETLIQAGLNQMKVESVDIRINLKKRDSRLAKNIFHYLYESAKTILGIYLLYRARVIFFWGAFFSIVLGLLVLVRYFILVHFYHSIGGMFWPSIILGSVFFVVGAQVFLAGILATLQSYNRELSEKIHYRIRKMENPFSETKEKNKMVA